MNHPEYFKQASLEESRDAIHPFVKAIKAPPNWPEIDATMTWAARCWSGNGMRVLVTCDTINGAEWVHLSVSRRSRTPSYEDLCLVRRIFFREDRPAYHVFPKVDEHRNFHAYCLHLWLPLGADPFPDPLGERANTIGPKPEDEHLFNVRPVR